MTTTTESADSKWRSGCPVACLLDVVGDRWSLLIVRDLLLGKSRYIEFASSPEGIPSNVLAERLKRLEKSGLIEKSVYNEKPMRYEYRLTAKGLDLLPVVNAMADWSLRHVPDVQVFPRYR